MPDPKVYRFKINAYSPETIPMARLAEYMAELAALLGHSDSVHFVRLEKGSTALLHKVEPEAIPKVDERLSEARSGALDKDIRKPLDRLNEMLREDNGDGDLQAGNNKILVFPGRNQRIPEPVGPFNQYTEIEGTLVRIGGRDKTAHAQVQDPEGETWNCELSRELARELAEYLYGTPIRIHGEGRWIRESDGAWSLKVFRAKGFHELKASGLKTAVIKLRDAAEGHWKDIEGEPLTFLRKIKGDDQEVH